ncbi:hypothetical protein C819_02637 [Lachnospiraceae bacterium 10-1]|jgi:hypothetical protein|nr:hypothetical protein C819_02637 [Lachnospiraceae bacterium 10-1]
MKKYLSPWSKDVKKAMIDADMDTNDLAAKMCWSRQHTSSIVNGRTYHRESVSKISQLFNLEIPPEKATLAKEK